MNIPMVLERMGLSDQDWGNSATDKDTYAKFASKWRGPKPVPSEAAMLAVWAVIVAEGKDAPASPGDPIKDLTARIEALEQRVASLEKKNKVP